MSAPRPSGGGAALTALAERACAGAGTDLTTVLTGLRTGQHDPATPAALRAGWATPDTTIPQPEPTDQEHT